MGNANPRAFTRGKRGIAGSCIFTVFDRHPLDELMKQAWYVAKDEDTSSTSAKPINEIFTVSNVLTLTSRLRKPEYADQIPPFDVTLSARNEYGQAAAMRIYGVEFLNEGSGTSVDDVNNEAQMTFVARHISHWTPVANEIDTLTRNGVIGFVVQTSGSTAAEVSTIAGTTTESGSNVIV